MGIFRTLGRLIGVAPSPAVVSEQLEEMRIQMKDVVEQLIPLTGKELELLSHLQTETHFRKGLTARARGTFTSIYHEPMVSYSYKDYFGNRKNAVLLVRTTKREFIYRMKPKKINVYVNKKPWGFLTRDFKFYGGSRNRLVGRIGPKNDRFFPIILGDEEVADIQDVNMSTSIHPRVFFFIRDMSFEKETLMLSLSLFFLISEYLETKYE